MILESNKENEKLMKKILSLLTLMILLAGCAETLALLGPASSLVGGGNIVHSSISSAASYGVKKTTGKSPMQHALAYAEEKNPNKKKERCLNFVKETESEACYIAKKKISSVKKSVSKKVKNIINQSKSTVVKKIKVEQEIPLQKKVKKVTVKKNKVEQKLKLRSVESMLVESALSKKQLSHLTVLIEKKF